MRPRRLEMWLGFALFMVLIGTGCQRTPVPIPSEREPAVSTAAAPTQNLATRLKSLSSDEQDSLRHLLTKPGSIDSKGDARLIAIARELCQLTLAEANELGMRLEAEQAHKVSEFALVPLQRQSWALDQIQQIQARMAKKFPPPSPEYPWVATAITADRDLAWLKDRTGAKVTEVITLILAHEPDDLGPVKSDISDDDLRVVAAFTGLERLDLRETQITDAGLAHLTGLRRLQFLNLSNTSVTDAGLRTVAELPGLSELQLQYTKVIGPGIEHLAKCTSLTKLILAQRVESPLELQHLNRLHSLKELEVTANGELDLHDLPQLVKLMISLVGTKDKPSVLRLANMPVLELASLNLFHSSDQRFKIENLPKLLRLDIRTDFRTFPFDQFGQLTNVRELTISDSVLEACAETDIRHLANLRHLTRLHLATKLKPGCIQHFQHLTALRQLSLGGDLDDAELWHLKNMKLMQVLSFREIQGSGQGFKVLQQMPALKELSLSQTDLETLHLVGLPAVRRLHLQKCRIGNLEFAGLPNLETVNINGLTTESISVKDLPKVRWLSFSLVDADKIRQVSLQDLPALQTLHLVPITQEGGIGNIPYVANLDDRLLADIAKLPKLDVLSIRYSAITDAGLQQLKSGPKIQSLEISGPHITRQAIQQLRKELNSR